MKRPSFLRSADIVTIVFVLALSVLEIIFAARIDFWLPYVLSNVVLLLFIYFGARAYHERGGSSNTAFRLVRDWYLYPCILFVYSQAASITYQIHRQDYDFILIMIDQTLFGVNPTQWISQFSHPVITELLQIAYGSYYLFFAALFFELYRRTDHAEFHAGSMLVVYGFYLSYIGYLLLPAIGPRFTLHDFYSVSTELPGLLLTDFLRSIVDTGGGIPAGSLTPAAFVNRDAFPSGHTQLTLVAMYVAFTTRSKIRWGLLIVGSLLIISTIYMRYHYVIDLIAGAAFFLFTVWSGKKINAWWKKSVSTEQK